MKAWLRAETFGVVAPVVVVTVGGTAGIAGAQTSEEGVANFCSDSSKASSRG